MKAAPVVPSSSSWRGDVPQRQQNTVAHNDAQHPHHGEPRTDVLEIYIGPCEEIPWH